MVINQEEKARRDCEEKALREFVMGIPGLEIVGDLRYIESKKGPDGQWLPHHFKDEAGNLFYTNGFIMSDGRRGIWNEMKLWRLVKRYEDKDPRIEKERY